MSGHKAQLFLEDALERRQSANSLRTLSGAGGTDFCSNDYLGFAASEQLSTRIKNALADENLVSGSGGSRLISGNSILADKLEKEIAYFHGSPAGLIFNSGYDANLGLLSCIAGRHDTIMYDELSHASIIDGSRLSHAKSYKFRHNRPDDLEKKLRNAKGNTFVVVESLYSMEGDFAPLREISEVCKKYDARLIVDEAHSGGVYGSGGKGMVDQEKLEADVFARLFTFGKALGCHGAIVCGSETLRSYLLNFARSFIYSTALPPHSLIAIQCAYELLAETHAEKSGELFRLCRYFSEKANHCGLAASPGQIQSIMISGNARARSAAKALSQNGLNVKAILSPTVPEGSERLRICLHTFNTKEETDLLFEELKKWV